MICLEKLKQHCHTYIYIQPKKIIWIGRKCRFGNHLYFFLKANKEREKGEKLHILYTENMEYLLSFFLELKELTIKKKFNPKKEPNIIISSTT